MFNLDYATFALIPALLLLILIIYQLTEASIYFRLGVMKNAAQLDIERRQERVRMKLAYYKSLRQKKWADEAYQLWLEGNKKAARDYENPLTRARLWLANIIAPN